jgi:hypothetical protein
VFRSFGGGTIALALLVCGMVFAAVAGPAQSLQTRTQAFQQTIAELGPTTKMAEATISVKALAEDISQVASGGPGVSAIVPGLILGLALGADERDLTLARLAVMGVRHGPRLALTQAIPAIAAAIIASVACALVLPSLTISALDLSVFTSSGLTTGTAPEVTLRPDLVSVGLPAAALLTLAVATLVIQAYGTGSQPSRLLRIS